MANILNQPKEIILEQCKELDNISLSNLIKSNRRLYEICNQVLYDRKLDRKLLDVVYPTVGGGFFDIFQYYKPRPEYVIDIFKNLKDSDIVIRQYINGDTGESPPLMETLSPKLELIYQSVAADKRDNYYIYKLDDKEFNLEFKLKIVEYLDFYGGGDYYDIFVKYIFFPGNRLTLVDPNPWDYYLEDYIVVGANPTTVKYTIEQRKWSPEVGTITVLNKKKILASMIYFSDTSVIELNDIPLDEYEIDTITNYVNS